MTDWGYDPVQFFAIKTAYGTPEEFKEFVERCHQNVIAVIVDVVYNHLVENNLLTGFGGFTLPQIPHGVYLYGGDRADTVVRVPIMVGHRSDSIFSIMRCYSCGTMAWTAFGLTIPLISACSGTRKQTHKECGCSRTSIPPIVTRSPDNLRKSLLPRTCRVQVLLPRRLLRAVSNSTVSGITQWLRSCATL